jgi:hypothetical protein
MKVSTQVDVTNKEIRDAIEEIAKKAAGAGAGSAAVGFYFKGKEDADVSLSVEQGLSLSAVVEFIQPNRH